METSSGAVTIMNDVGNVHTATGTDPIGLEVHASTFAFDRVGDLGNTTFHRYKLHQKAQESLSEAYFGIYSDFDLGNFDDDYLGSDTTLGIGIGFKQSIWKGDTPATRGDRGTTQGNPRALFM